jgi:hypothetical protein
VIIADTRGSEVAAKLAAASGCAFQALRASAAVLDIYFGA